MTLTLGPLVLDKIVVVAEIEDDCLLGNDILLKDPSGPAVMLLNQRQIILRDYVIPCILVGVDDPPSEEMMNKPFRRAYAADDFVVPAMTEALVDVLVDREIQKNTEGESCTLMEASTNFLKLNKC
jgi:hypothetical protein